MNSLIYLNLTEPITELVKVVRNGIGTLYEPRRIRKKAEAEAKAIEITEHAKTNAEIERRERLNESNIRIYNRLITQERNRQKNIDDIVDIAANQLKDEKEVPQDKVKADWATRFFNTVQDISDEEMKLIWGKLLAGEIKTPGSYSLRAIELLKNLTSEEALLFTEASKLALKRAHDIVIIQSDNINNDYGLTFDKILTLTDAGLLKPIIETAITLKAANNPDMFDFTYGNYAVKAIAKSEEQVSTYVFSIAGSKIYNLIDNPEVNLDYLKKVLKSISNDKVKFQIYKITKWNDFNDFDIDEKNPIDINVY